MKRFLAVGFAVLALALSVIILDAPAKFSRPIVSVGNTITHSLTKLKSSFFEAYDPAQSPDVSLVGISNHRAMSSSTHTQRTSGAAATQAVAAPEALGATTSTADLTQIQTLVNQTFQSYIATGKLIGPQGPQGPQGIQGIQGPPSSAGSIQTFGSGGNSNDTSGTILGVTELSARDLTVSNNTALNDLAVSGALNANSLALANALSVSNGGTGVSTLTPYGILFGNGTSAIGSTDAGALGQCLQSSGGTSAPGWGACTPVNASAWSSLINPLANLALSMQGFTTALTYSNTTGAGTNLFTLTDTASNTGTGYLLNVATATGSSLKPLQIVAAGTPALTIDSTGLVTANNFASSSVAVTGGTESGVAVTTGSINNTPIGVTTPAAANFTSIGGTTAGTGTFTTIQTTGLTTLGGNLTFTASSPILDATTGTFNINTTTNRPVTFGTGLVTANNFASSSAAITGGTESGVAFTTGSINNTPVGVTTPASANFTSIGGTAAGTGTFTTLSATSLGLTNALTVANGGTGDQTLAADGILYGNGSSAVGVTAVGTSGQCLQSNGAGNAPTFGACTASGLRWDQLLNPTGSLALSMGSNTTTFTYGATTGSNNLFNLTDTASNTGTGYLLNLTTAASSTLKPLQVVAAGTSALSINATGLVTANNFASSSVAVTGGTESGVAITTGSIDNTPIGATSMASGAFSTIGIAGAPVANTTENIASAAVSGTNSYGLQVNAPTGATNNYAAVFSGGNVGIGTTLPAAAPASSVGVAGQIYAHGATALDLPASTALAAFRWALAKGTANIVIIGDSVGEGTGATTRANGWAYLLASRLKVAQGDAGPGFLGLHRTDLYTFTGTWGPYTTFGPDTQYAAGSTNTIAMSAQTCLSYKVYFLGTTSIDLQVDGGSWVETVGVLPSGGSIYTATISAGSLGSHTLGIRPHAATTAYVLGVTPVVSATGVTVNNLSVVGSTTATWGTYSNQTNILYNLNPNLVIVSLGINDVANLVSAVDYTTRMGVITAQATARGANVLILGENPTFRTGTAPDNVIQGAQKALAVAGGFDYINSVDRWGSYTAANAAGMMSDTLHPSTAGHLDIADFVTQHLLPYSSNGWSDNGTTITAPAGRNIGIGTTTPTLGPLQMASGAYVTTGGVWTNASDRNLKENFTPVDPADILNKINTLPVTEWDYKTEGPAVKHIGPVAQDFYSVFALGNNNTSISTIDPAGVALLGIQALSKQLQNIQGSLSGNVNTSGTLTISEPEVLQSTLTVLKLVTFSGDTVGEAEIKAGATSVRIAFSEQYQYQPIVTLTPEGQAITAYLTDKDATGFTINIANPLSSDVTFDWHAFGAEGAKLTVSDGTTQDITVLPPSSSAAGTSGSGTVNAEPAPGSAQSSASSSANGNQIDSAGTATPVSSPDTTTSSNVDSTSITTSSQSGATSSSGTDNVAQPGSSEPVTTSGSDAPTSSTTAASPQGQAVNAVQ
jgi:lysophospholipase L1-like esterase